MLRLGRVFLPTYLSLVLVAIACGGRQEFERRELTGDDTPALGGSPSTETNMTRGGQAIGAMVGAQPGTSLGGSTVATTTTTLPPPCDGFLIDDMEDGSGRIKNCKSRVGVWYAFNDTDGGTQWPAVTKPGTPIETSEIPNGRGSSRRAMHTYGGKDTRSFDWWAGIGFDLNFDGTSYGHYDASQYDGITFWLRGSATCLEVRFHTVATTLPIYGGTYSGTYGAPASMGLSSSDDWKQWWVPFTSLYTSPDAPKFDPRDLTNVQFYCGVNCREIDFWVDDVAFY